MKGANLLSSSLFVLIILSGAVEEKETGKEKEKVKEKVPITTLENLTSIETSPRIVFGNPAKPGQFPWQVAVIATNQRSTCGGALIHERFVLTAAHCVEIDVSFTIHLGSTKIPPLDDPDRVTVHSTEAIHHEEYDNQLLHHDVALIRLPSPVKLNDKIRVIPLAAANEYLGPAKVVTVSGWGKTSDESNVASNTLNYVELTTIGNDECRGVFGEVVTEGTICCRGQPHHSTCNGDSGGPLVVQNKDGGPFAHVGVVSFVAGSGCTSGYPSGYMRTSYYRRWIEHNIQNWGFTTSWPPSWPPSWPTSSSVQTTPPSSASSMEISILPFVVAAYVIKQTAF